MLVTFDDARGLRDRVGLDLEEGRTSRLWGKSERETRTCWINSEGNGDVPRTTGRGRNFALIVFAKGTIHRDGRSTTLAASVIGLGNGSQI